MLAAELKMDPAEIRLKNFVGKDEFPFATATGLIYDSGNYAAPLHEGAGHGRTTPKLREEQAQARAEGRLIGIGHLDIRRNLRVRAVARHARRRMGERDGARSSPPARSR